MGGVSLAKLPLESIEEIFNFSEMNDIDEIDSAPAYSNLEEKLSRTSFDRDKWKINSKIGSSNHESIPPDGIFTQVSQSLRKIGLSSFHTVFVHSVPMEKISDSQLTEILNLKKDGLARRIGYSSTSNPDDLKEAIKLGIFDSLQITHNPIDHSPLYRNLLEDGSEIYLKRVLGSGLLNTSPKSELKLVLKKLLGLSHRYNTDGYHNRFQEMFGITLDKTNYIEYFIRFALSSFTNPRVILGFSNTSQLKELTQTVQQYEFDKNQFIEETINDFEKYQFKAIEINWTNLR